jgi:outer membrane protein TolC
VCDGPGAYRSHLTSSPSGDTSRLELLNAQRALFRAELDLESARRAEAAGAVALFKALGGGWELTAKLSRAAHAAGTR